MKKINKNYILSFLVFIFSLGIVSAWTNLGTVTSGTNLTDTLWNNLITQVNETGNRVSGIFTDGSGNVGIGTETPGAKLQVTGGQTVLEQQSWQNVTFQNSWIDYGVDYSPTSYFKDSNGVVHLRGLLKNGTIGVCAFTLPTGYRPPYRVLFTVQTNPNVASRFDIQASGCAIVNGSNARTSLDGISFATH